MYKFIFDFLLNSGDIFFFIFGVKIKFMVMFADT